MRVLLRAHAVLCVRARLCVCVGELLLLEHVRAAVERVVARRRCAYQLLAVINCAAKRSVGWACACAAAG